MIAEFANVPESEIAPDAENVPAEGPNGFWVSIVVDPRSLAVAAGAETSDSGTTMKVMMSAILRTQPPKGLIRLGASRYRAHRSDY